VGNEILVGFFNSDKEFLAFVKENETAAGPV
jgi:hypothetical protein